MSDAFAMHGMQPLVGVQKLTERKKIESGVPLSSNFKNCKLSSKLHLDGLSSNCSLKAICLTTTDLSSVCSDKKEVTFQLSIRTETRGGRKHSNY